MTDPPLRVRPVGDAALTVEFGEAIDLRANASVRALDRLLAERPLPGMVEAVPTYRSLLVAYDPERASYGAMSEALRGRAVFGGAMPAAGPLHTIPTVYGGRDGPDLTEVAAACALREDDVIRLHTSRELTAFMLGFMPGFAYLGYLPEALALPRRSTPRLRVPAGSVAIAGRQAGIYPRASPGGWHLIGRTAVCLFDPCAEPPTLIAPGDRVRFVRVPEAPETGPAPAPRAASPHPSVLVIEPGLLTTVQAAARCGHRRLGVAGSGPLDAGAHAAANRAVGNSPDDAALEVTLAGPTLRFLRSTRVAIAGADLGAILERSDLGAWEIPLGHGFLARPDNLLRFRERRTGSRAYVAFSGGVDVPLVLGSGSTDLAGGFGGYEGRALRGGDLLSVGPAGEGRAMAGFPGAIGTGVARLRVVLGPQDDHFTPETVRRFLAETYSLGVDSDRIGCRLRGAEIAAATGPLSEIVSDGMVPGVVQVPPDGQPIVMLAEGPTTGGYPKIATVIGADLDRLAQLVPGEGRVRFEAVEVL